MKPAPFGGSTASQKLKKHRFLAKNGHNAEFSVAENGGVRGGATKKFSPRTKNCQKCIGKNFQGADQVLGLCSPLKAQKRPKIGDFWKNILTKVCLKSGKLL